jgi:hypothetical protein
VLEEIERDVGLALVDRLADRAQVVADAERVDLVPQLGEEGGDVELGLPVGSEGGVAGGVGRRYQTLVHQGQDAQLSQSHTRCRPLWR